MGQKTPSFTMKESLAVLDEALDLLATPEQWTTGTWKCELWERDKVTGLTLKDGLNYVQRKDEHGRPMFAYCIEGAVNQAVINKFGPIRAKALGALNPEAPVKSEPEGYNTDQIDCGKACDLLSINDITIELYGAEYDYLRDSERPAQALNDANDNERDYGYADVMHVLRTKRDRIAAAIAAKFKS